MPRTVATFACRDFLSCLPLLSRVAKRAIDRRWLTIDLLVTALPATGQFGRRSVDLTGPFRELALQPSGEAAVNGVRGIALVERRDPSKRARQAVRHVAADGEGQSRRVEPRFA